MSYRPSGWNETNSNPCLDCPEKLSGYAGKHCHLYCGELRDYLSREDGADLMYLAFMAQRPSRDEIMVRIVDCLYGGSTVSDLLGWLKERLLIWGKQLDKPRENMV